MSNDAYIGGGKNYFTGKEVTAEDAAEVKKIVDLELSYNIIRPVYESESESDMTKQEFEYTPKFEAFRNNFFIPFAKANANSITSSLKSIKEITQFELQLYIYLEQITRDKGKDKEEDETSFDLEKFTKWCDTVSDKTLSDIFLMSRAEAGMATVKFDRSYENNHQILQRMIDLNILRKHGELTSDFKYFLEEVCKQENKTLDDIVDTDPEDNSWMVFTIVMYLDMSMKEFKKLCSSKARHAERLRLEQMAWVVKRCLMTKK